MFKCSWEKEATRQDGRAGGQRTQRETLACCRTELITPIFQHISTARGRLERKCALHLRNCQQQGCEKGTIKNEFRVAVKHY